VTARAAQRQPAGPGRPAGRVRHRQEGTQAQAAAQARQLAAQQLAAEWMILEAQVRAQFPAPDQAAAVLAEAARIQEQLRRRRAAQAGDPA
jgi:hypothetical protein